MENIVSEVRRDMLVNLSEVSDLLKAKSTTIDNDLFLKLDSKLNSLKFQLKDVESWSDKDSLIMFYGFVVRGYRILIKNPELIDGIASWNELSNNFIKRFDEIDWSKLPGEMDKVSNHQIRNGIEASVKNFQNIVKEDDDIYHHSFCFMAVVAIEDFLSYAEGYRMAS